MNHQYQLQKGINNIMDLETQLSEVSNNYDFKGINIY